MTAEISPTEHIELASDNLNAAIEFLANKKFTALNNALICLFKEAHRESQRLLVSLHDLTWASLSVRSLFEIYLISKHIYSAQQALADWYGQLHGDFTEVNKGFLTLAEKKGLDTSKLEDVLRLADQSLAQSAYVSKKGFKVRDLAESFGHLDDYKFIYKLSSKLVHPTSMKVMAHEELVGDSSYLSVVIQTGVYICQELTEFLGLVVRREK